ncbi:MAG: hypothetical protein RMH77_07145 [Sulfolobales archaeon]|nr:hypothetical protein [Sulfolobales archaeon]MDW7970154.1 hypothetical protein [Sulfolobales archaeon]
MSKEILMELPPRGYVARRFVELSTLFLRGVKIVDDELVIESCLDFQSSLEEVLKSLEGRGVRNIFLTGNDRRYVTNEIAVKLGLDPGVLKSTLDILKAFLKAIKEGSLDECIPKDLLNTELAVLNLLKANFYEYGKIYLTKPSDKYITMDKLPITIQLLAIIGVLIADVGRAEDAHYYLLPPEGISGEVKVMKQNEIIEILKMTASVLRNYVGLPKVLIILRIASGLVEVGYKNDLVVGEVVGINESGNRATVVYVEPVSTEGLVTLINSAEGTNAKKLSAMLRTLLDASVRLTPKGPKGGNVFNIIVKVANDILIYSRTGSLDAICSALSLLWRLTDDVRVSKSESVIAFVNALEDEGVKEPYKWLSSLVSLLSLIAR